MNLIVGGTGALGSALATRLLREGAPVRVLTRTPGKAAGLAAQGAEVVRGDLLDQDSLARACRGAEVVFAVAHSIFGRGKTASAHVDDRGHRDLIDAAAGAGVRRFVYTSVYDYGPAYRAIPFFGIKYQIEAHLKASRVPFTILRPTAFMETHAHQLIGEPVLRNGKTVLFGRGEQPRNFVAADDVARVALQAVEDPATAGETLEIGGPENLTNMDVVRIYERLLGRPAKVTHVPLGVLQAISRLARPLHPGLAQVLQAGIAAETTDQRFDARALQQRFGIALTRLENWAEERHRGVANPRVPVQLQSS